MDIYCPVCAEPWENDFFHELEPMSYDQATRMFRAKGCGILIELHKRAMKDGKENADIPADEEGKYRCSIREVPERCENLATTAEKEEIELRKTRAAASAALMDVLGDDMDGIASELEDFEYLMRGY
jgi:hypothetical protein